MSLAAVLLAIQVQAVVLGVAQDGGVPHLGCSRDPCEAARRDPARAERVAALGLVATGDGSAARYFMIDATPDFRSQVDALLGADRVSRPKGRPLDGILLTHAHIGHYTGLMYLGRESMASAEVPVYASERMAAFLRGNGPWKRLVSGGHVALQVVQPGNPVVLCQGLQVEPIRVAHREEESDALGFIVRGPKRSLIYIPDIDAWERWDRDIAALVGTVDVALLDATFYGPGELGDRPMDDVPHPFVLDTMKRLQPLARDGRRIIFIHMNHTNPALLPGSPERMEIERRGFEVASDGTRIDL